MATPAQHATDAATELARSKSTTGPEREIAALAAQGHAILSKKAGTGTDYADAEALLTTAQSPHVARLVYLHQAIAHAQLAD